MSNSTGATSPLATRTAKLAFGLSVLAFGVSLASLRISYGQLSRAKSQLDADHERSRRQTALDAYREWRRSQPPNGAKCIELLSVFQPSELERVVARVDVPLIEKDQRHGLALSCFSDTDPKDLSELLSGGKLTAKGSSLLAARVNTAIHSDEVIALAIKYGTVDVDVIRDVMGSAVTKSEIDLVAKLRSIPGHERDWPALPLLFETVKIAAPEAPKRPLP